MESRLTSLLRVVRHAHLRRLAVAYGLFAVAEHATWIAVTVYAFARGGVGEAGIVAVVQLVPAIVVAPLAANAGDRFRKDRVLVLGYGAQAISMLATAAAMWTEGTALSVYAAATAAAVAVTFTRPAMGALLPIVTATPADLIAANVCKGVLEHLGVFLGPALAGVVLQGQGGPALVFAVMGVATAVAAAAVARLGIDRSLLVPPADVDDGDVFHDVLGGFRTLRREPDLRLLILVGALSTVVAGAADVLFVAVPHALLHDSSAATAGLLGAAFGLGALLGALGSVALVGRLRLVAPLVVAVAVSAVAFALMGAMSHLASVLTLFMLSGAGGSVARIAAASLVPRFAPPAVLSRVFGVIEGLDMAALAVGAAGVSALVRMLGLRAGLVVLGIAIPAVLAVRAGRLRRLSATTPAPNAALVRLVAGNQLFAHLPPPMLERLLASMESHEFDAGVEIVRQDDEGDRYYLVERGELAVVVNATPARTLRAGSGFGEIALVRDVPRTATVTSTTAVALHSVRRDDFLAALVGHRAALDLAEEQAQRVLDDDASRDAQRHG